jgi:hypothetical protein
VIKRIGDIKLIKDGCRWFLLCKNKATKTRPHPILGAVPICKRCDDKVARLGA